MNDSQIYDTVENALGRIEALATALIMAADAPERDDLSRLMTYVTDDTTATRETLKAWLIERRQRSIAA